MPNGYPSPFGQHDGGAMSQPQDPRALPVAAPGPVQWPDFHGEAGAERRRTAKGHAPRTLAEIKDSMWGRPPAKRTPWPVVGQQIRFVREEWGAPEPATVVQVQDPADSDINLRMPLHKNGEALHGMSGEPAPWVVLQTADGFVTQCREARVRGSAGWLP